MTNYEELLNRPEWHRRRNEILERDNHKCTNCNDSELLKSTKIRGFLGSITINDNIIQITSYNPGSQLRNLKKTFIPKLLYEKYIGHRENIVLFTRDNEKEIEFVNVIGIGELRNGLITILHNLGLHIHHLYYQDDLLPWEYPGEALTTLCWVCHEKLHQTNQVPRLSKDGVNYDSLTPCFRCYGAGVFPQYNHIEYGICFRCRGAKYEELITSNLISIGS
jgi:5-methylcytosine-specific restriction endonuclease McrA